MSNDILSSFSSNLNVAIIGASGGIGRAFVEHFAASDKVAHVYAFSRSPCDFSSTKVTTHPIDITDEGTIADSVKVLGKALGDTSLDIVIVATGVLHGDDVIPEKSIKDCSLAQFEEVFAVNTYGPALVAKHFLPLIPKDRKSVFAALSARVSSIGDNRLGGWHAYRASKSALNMILKNTAIETARRYKHACVIGLHPGTVDTELSEPFQGNVPNGKLFTPEHSAECLIQVINNATPQNSGCVFAWDGQVIPA